MITQAKVLTANPEMVEVFFKRAKKGAAALRTKLGKTWYRRINTSALMMDSSFSCVLELTLRPPDGKFPRDWPGTAEEPTMKGIPEERKQKGRIR